LSRRNRTSREERGASKFDAIYWTVAIAVFGFFVMCKFGGDWVSRGMVLAAAGAGALGLWEPLRHVATWLSGGVAAVSGALLTLIIGSQVDGGTEDPATAALLVAFVASAAVSAVLRIRDAAKQARRERVIDERLAALPTADQVAELGRRLDALSITREQAATVSWIEWWRSRPTSHRVRPSD
jgi:peptidoglycan/LPS O-acetylase OafA/YrhL